MITFAKTLPYLTLVMVLESMSFPSTLFEGMCLAESHKPPPPPTPRRGERLWFGLWWSFGSFPLSFAVESPLHLLWGTTLPSVLSDTPTASG